MRTFALTVTQLIVLTAALPAQAPNTLRISDETAPPGGVAQIKFLLTSPQPISSGMFNVDFEADFVEDLYGIALQTAGSDVSGAAVVNGRKLGLRLLSPNASFGDAVDYPLLTVAAGISATALPGLTAPVTLGGGFVLTGPSGAALPIEVKPGSLTVGGSLSIGNVVPGGGPVAAGSTIRLLGTGFTPKTKVKIGEAKIESVTFVDSGELWIIPARTLDMEGRLIRVSNPSGEERTYYSYLRAVPLGVSTEPLIARTVPIFSSTTLAEGTLPPTTPASLNPNYVTAIAVQNPGSAAATVRFELVDAAGSIAGRASISLPGGMRFSRELRELFGLAPQLGSSVHVVASAPVQMLGLLGNQSDGSVQPVGMVPGSVGSPRP